MRGLHLRAAVGPEDVAGERPDVGGDVAGGQEPADGEREREGEEQDCEDAVDDAGAGHGRLLLLIRVGFGT